MTDQGKGKAPAHYENNFQHLSDELKRLDLLIQLRVQVFRQNVQSDEETLSSKHVYISHSEVDRLLSRQSRFPSDELDVSKIKKQLEAMQYSIDARISRSLEKNIFLALPQLARLFALSPFEIQAVITCLASELRRKYDKLYAYLQDDITRKKPSIDLVLDLLCNSETDKWNTRTTLAEHAPLMRSGILQAVEDTMSPSGSSGLARFLKLDPRILGFLTGRNYVDEQLMDVARLHGASAVDLFVDREMTAKLLRLIRSHFTPQPAGKKRMVLYLQGPYGSGKQELALTLCGQLGCAMLSVDMDLLRAQPARAETLLRLAFREGLLMQAALYVDNADLLSKDENRSLLKTLSTLTAEFGWLVFLTGEKPWIHKGAFSEALLHTIEIPVPDVSLRRLLWERGLSGGLSPAASWSEELAGRYRLTPGQITDAIQFLEAERSMQNVQTEVTLADVSRACRKQSNERLGELAARIEPRYGWQDIILPDDKISHLKEICSQVKYRYRVFQDWGFDQKLSHGKGLSMLFSGSPGTGKTMAAQVIARELQLELYRIDLSGVVSKYIGETEKNLSRIFEVAETGNAILFFDEADALFGKRTDVSDAHDRYANIETSYLLQKMEEYEGVVILATNLRENMDDAFIRRIRFIVDFPFPDEAGRRRIWQTHFPKEAPTSESLDYEYLSREFKIAGGSIKNIVLNSAFLAAENGGVIRMEHILHGARREFEKIGKSWIDKDARQPRSKRV